MGPSTPDVSYHCKVEGTSSAENTLPNAVQETVDLLCCEVTSLARVQLIVHQNTQVLLCRPAFQSVGLQFVLVSGVIPPLVQHFALPFVELHEVSICPVLQPVKVPLNGSKPI